MMIGNEDDPAYSSYVGEDEHMEEVGYQTRYEDANDFVWDKMWERIWTLNQPHVITFSMETATAFEEIDFEDADYKTLAECSDVNSKFYSGLYSFGPCAHTENLIFVSYRLNVHGAKRMWVRLASSDKETVEDFQRRIVTQLKPIKTDENTVKVKFWNWGGHAPDYNVRHLEAPTWDEIKGNYAPSAVGDLDRFVNLKAEDITGGRLAIIHGPPGTGKTTMIRALCREWRKWCNVDYIIDPEQFFGNAQYMTSTLMASGEDIPDYFDEDDENDYAIEQLLAKYAPHPSNRFYPGKTDGPEPWRLLIIEDAEEFINPNAQAHVGQALSRLLNVGDGFIGQGLNILILLTTNVAITDVHPAIKRPGRCFANIEVPNLSASESARWLGTKSEVGERSLAELFEEQKKGQIGSGVAQYEAGGYL
jgi:hypothetical protein